MTFQKNDTFELSGVQVKILDVLGEGGQGEVYLVQHQGKKQAFKYYKENPSSDFVYNLKNNVAKGSPSDNFLWPKEVVEFTDGSVGYLMELRPNRFVSFVSYLSGKTRFKDETTKLRWCIELVKSFKLLHERGYSYQDLNDGSFFFDSNTGDLLICDNDNVTADKRSLGVLGKMRYMAPEIVRADIDKMTGERQMPDTHSDRFSLAVILFLTFCLGNPFEGERLKKYAIVNEEAEFELFGKHPLYIYNQSDVSNRPIRGYHTAVLKRYPLLPSYIKAAFHRTFVDGLKDRENGRTNEVEWLKLLCRYRDELITCGCGKQYAAGLWESKMAAKCPYCRQQSREFAYLQLGKHKVVLEPGKPFYEPHLNKFSSCYNQPVGAVVTSKNNPGIWGIRLPLPNGALIKDRLGNEKAIAPNGVIPIVSELKIKLSEGLIGEIRTNQAK